MTRQAIYTLLLTLFFSVGIWAQREAHSIKIDPIAAVNPVKTQHTFIATVLDASGKPMAGQRVEWILARDPNKGVGDIVDHDGKGSIFGNTKIYKIANNYTVTFTSKAKRTVKKHTGDPKDDVQIGVGQTWCTITSPLEGETHVIAYCPAIRNHNKHKAFAIKYWIDAKLGWPKDAINRIGEPHTFTFTLRKASSNVPLPGYRIRWELQKSGPNGHLGGGDRVKETVTDEEGSTSVTLKQKEKKSGRNVVKLELREANGRLLAVREAVKTWISPALAIKKSGPAIGILDETITYSITVTNNGAAEARKVRVTDTLPEGFAYKTSSQKPKVRGKKVTWDFGTLKKGASAKVSITVTAKKVGTWTNTAQVSSDQGPGPKSSVVTKVGAPELYIIKKGPKEVRLGDLATYTLTIKNKGNAVAKGVGIRDEVPQGMQYKNKKTGFALKWKIGNLKPGGSKTVRYRLKTVRTGTFTNIAIALLGRRKVHEAKWTTRVVAPDLTVSKRVSSNKIYLGKEATFTITVANKGTGTARNVVVTDTLPNKLEYISSTPPGAVKPATKTEPAIIIWKLGDIGPKKDIKIKLRTRGLLVGAATNTVKATSEGRSVDAKARVIIEGVPAVHINSYDTEDPVEVGKLTIYVIEIRNEGTSPCTNVVLKDDIPDEMEYVSSSGPKEATAKGRRITFAPVPILQPGEKVIYRIVCKAIKEGSAKNHGILTYKEFVKPIIDEEGTSIYK